MSKEDNWLARNWGKLLIGLFLAIGLVITLFVGGILFIVRTAMTSSDVYKESVSRAVANKEITSQLGEPIKTGWFISGSIKVNNDRGNADLAIPISGPKASATIYVIATKENNIWKYQKIAVTMENNIQIDLLTRSNE